MQKTKAVDNLKKNTKEKICISWKIVDPEIIHNALNGWFETMYHIEQYNHF